MRRLKSMQTKMLFYFIALFLIMLVSFAVFYEMTVESLHNVATDSVEKTIQQANSDTYKTLLEARRLAYNVARDGEIQKSLRGELPEVEREVYKERLDYNYKLYYMNKFAENIDGMFVIGENGAIYRSSERTLRKQEFRDEDWYKEVMWRETTLWIKAHPGSEIVQNTDYPTISIAVPIEDRASSRILGVVVVDVLASNLRRIDESGLAFEGKTYILDEKNQVMYEEGATEGSKTEAISEAFAGKNLDKKSIMSGDIIINGEKHLFTSMKLINNDWKTVGLISYEEIFSRTADLKRAMIWAMIMFAFIAIALAILGARGISKPIKKVRSTMKQVEKGDFTVRAEVESEDEIGELAQGFNHMLVKIRNLMEQEIESQEKLRFAELKALQSQINPHFLYNTLDSINWMARMNRVDKVSEMIDSLTVFFRISLSKGRSFISVREELTHVEKYIAIQKIRYERILESRIQVPEEFYECDIVKMTLQPLVENALYHGIKEKDEPGLISITANEKGRDIEFCVSDTGLGMTQEKVREVQRMMDEGIEYNPDAYGIINVQKRLRMYFGNKYGLRFESEQGRGTRVYVLIPRRKGGV